MDTDQRTEALSAQVERALEHLILSGELKPGDQLKEIELAGRFGTSRGPLREAIQALHARGFVEMVRNRGVFVRSISTREAIEVYEVRAAIFGLAGRLLTDVLNDQMLDTMHGMLDDLDRLAEARDFEGYYLRNLEFHDFLITSAGNSILAAEYRGLVKKLHLCRARNLVQVGGLSVSNREHREMVDAVASGDRMRAQEAFYRHVERAKLRFLTTLRSEPTSPIHA